MPAWKLVWSSGNLLLKPFEYFFRLLVNILYVEHSFMRGTRVSRPSNVFKMASVQGGQSSRLSLPQDDLVFDRKQYGGRLQPTHSSELVPCDFALYLKKWNWSWKVRALTLIWNAKRILGGIGRSSGKGFPQCPWGVEEALSSLCTFPRCYLKGVRTKCK